ncbi:unnamed protein product, partial [Ectocarpus sp. 8 AP-2014]
VLSSSCSSGRHCHYTTIHRSAFKRRAFVSILPRALCTEWQRYNNERKRGYLCGHWVLRVLRCSVDIPRANSKDGRGNWVLQCTRAKAACVAYCYPAGGLTARWL